MTIKLLPTNNEDIDNDGFWSQLGDSKNRMGSKYATTKFSNKKDGLEQDEVYEQSNQAAALANSAINMKGSDHSGGTLKGNNDGFQLAVEIDAINKNPEPASSHLYAEFLNQIQSGNISIPDDSPETLQKLAMIRDLLP